MPVEQKKTFLDLASLAGPSIAAGDLVPIWDTSAAESKQVAYSAFAQAVVGASGFATRAGLVAAHTLFAVGSVVSAAGYFYRYIGTGTAISDLPGWVPNGEAYPEHWGAAGDGTTNDATAYASDLAAETTKLYAVTSTISHPDVIGAIEIDLSGSAAASPVYRMRRNHSRLTGKLKAAATQGFGILVDANAQGFHITDMDLETAGFALVVKPSNGTGGLARLGYVSGVNIHGIGTTADVGISVDGDTEGFVAIGNTISNLQRSDHATRPAHAYAVAGLGGGGGPTADSRNILFGLSAVYDVAGNVVHLEDANPGMITIGLMGQKIKKGIEIINDDIPILHTHLTNSFAEWGLYAIDNVGTGSSRMHNYAFNLMDGTLATVASGPNVRINQQATRDINYIGNMHYNLTGDGLESTAEGRIHIAFNAWDTVSGNAIRGRASIGATRGILVHSTNSFRSVGAIIDTALGANIMGDQIIGPVTLISSLATSDVILHAKRAGYLTKVTRVVDDTPVAAGANAVFTLLKRTPSGTETTLLTNSIPRTPAAYDTFSWTVENAQMLQRQWDAGDILILRCDGGGSAGRSAAIEVEFFEYN